MNNSKGDQFDESQDELTKRYKALWGDKYVVMEREKYKLFIFSPSDERPFFTLVTNGFSDHKLANIFRGGRFELIFYLKTDFYALLLDDDLGDLKKENDLDISFYNIVSLFDYLIDSAVNDGFTYHHLDTVAGNKLWPFSKLMHFLMLTPVIKPDQEVLNNLAVKNDKVEMLNFKLITHREKEFIKQNRQGFLKVLDDNQSPFFLDLEYLFRDDYV
jgi:hypothetical protein